MLFLTSVITAVILTATGVIYMFYSDLQRQEEQSIPQSVSWVEKDASRFQVMKPETAENTLKKLMLLSSIRWMPQGFLSLFSQTCRMEIRRWKRKLC